MYSREDLFITTWSLACLPQFLIAQIFLKCLIIASLFCEALAPCYRQASDRILPFKPNPTGFNATPCPANHHHLQSAQRNLLSYHENRISSYSLWEDSRCQKSCLIQPSRMYLHRNVTARFTTPYLLILSAYHRGRLQRAPGL
jgi:hypothetical protein